mmetsp:Transcript_81214/g.161072  ORF Transcript_81214/g.161072 Transcript_81214/m.161072 type:complete len:444 (-) Transcript_81214:53-1384(-)|eukprot:CAMPEP_0172776400 /NCGR_PEP_ID=MMETSP1074-20121228/199794_1 /TAXON_ID=2916 /ORGANISM="Ceratium fusus, Strain PA161109" /LENGTH=443 /DNA_ID=CAMNT_0013613173 /DNA_START=18 /DNA_END=1349 /DNA_ORIENTATION=-
MAAIGPEMAVIQSFVRQQDTMLAMLAPTWGYGLSWQPEVGCYNVLMQQSGLAQEGSCTKVQELIAKARAEAAAYDAWRAWAAGDVEPCHGAGCGLAPGEAVAEAAATDDVSCWTACGVEEDPLGSGGNDSSSGSDALEQLVGTGRWERVGSEAKAPQLEKVIKCRQRAQCAAAAAEVIRLDASATKIQLTWRSRAKVVAHKPDAAKQAREVAAAAVCIQRGWKQHAAARQLKVDETVAENNGVLGGNGNGMRSRSRPRQRKKERKKKGAPCAVLGEMPFLEAEAQRWKDETVAAASAGCEGAGTSDTLLPESFRQKEVAVQVVAEQGKLEAELLTSESGGFVKQRDTPIDEQNVGKQRNRELSESGDALAAEQNDGSHAGMQLSEAGESASGEEQVDDEEVEALLRESAEYQHLLQQEAKLQAKLQAPLRQTCAKTCKKIAQC